MHTAGMFKIFFIASVTCSVGSSAHPEILCLMGSRRINNSVGKSSPLDHILSQFRPFHVSTTRVAKSEFSRRHFLL
jgi:hypothetical protein